MTDKTLKHILYVEDDEDIQKIVKLSLETIGGFMVEVCSSGMEALDYIKNNNTMPDLILLDVMMPKMDGPATLDELRKIPGSEKIPVIFITAKAQKHEVFQYQKNGVLDVITKPFDPVNLPLQVKSIWSEAYEQITS